MWMLWLILCALSETTQMGQTLCSQYASLQKAQNVVSTKESVKRQRGRRQNKARKEKALLSRHVEVIGALVDRLTPLGNQAGGDAGDLRGFESNYPQFIIQNSIVYS